METILNILLTNNGKRDALAIVFTFLAFGGGAFILAYVFSTIGDVRDTVKHGGLKGYYPNLIKFIMQNYPLARVVTDTSLHMTILSDDPFKDVTMSFSLTLNSENKHVKIEGKIIPGNGKWAWIPPKEFTWILDTAYGADYGEKAVIKEIQEDMVFNPEIDYGFK